MPLLARLEDFFLGMLALIGALAIAALMIHVMADVIMRNAANSPIPATYEIVTKYYMIALAFIPLAWVERRGGMVQVEIVDPFLSASALAWSDRFVAAFSATTYGALAWVSWLSALDAFATGQFVMAQSTRLPIWPAYFFVPVGFGLACLVVLVRAFRANAGRPA